MEETMVSKQSSSSTFKVTETTTTTTNTTTTTTATATATATLVDQFLMQDIMQTHADSHELLELDFHHLFYIIKNVALQSTQMADCAKKPPVTTTLQFGIPPPNPRPMEDLTLPPSIINQVCCEITCKAVHSKSEKETLVSLFKVVSRYSWASKAVLTLTAFTRNYAEFRHWWSHTTETSQEVPKCIGFLKGVRRFSNPLTGTGQPQVLSLLDGILQDAVSMTEWIVHIELGCKNKHELYEVDGISRVVAMIMRVILSCSDRLYLILNKGFEVCKVEDTERLSVQVKEVYSDVKQFYEGFQHMMVEMKERQKLLEALSVRSNVNVVDLIRALYGCGDGNMDGDRFELVIGSRTKTTYKVEYLREKNVLLLMTDTMNIAEKDLSVLKTIYSETKFKEEGYEIVWIPLVDAAAAATEKHSESFVRLREQMPWCTPSKLVHVKESVIKVVKENWYLEKESMVVVKDKSGCTKHPNATSMIGIWGSKAFPFTPSKEHELWSACKDSWFDFVVSGCHQEISTAIKSDKCIFLYGSKDQTVLKETEKHVEYASRQWDCLSVNVGTNPDFGNQLKKCLLSILQTKVGLDSPAVMEMVRLYTFFKQEGGFMVLSRGSQVVINSSFRVMSKVFGEFSRWKAQVTDPTRLHIVIKGVHEKHSVQQECHQICLPYFPGLEIKDLKCPTCTSMPNCDLMLECCHGKH